MTNPFTPQGEIETTPTQRFQRPPPSSGGQDDFSDATFALCQDSLQSAEAGSEGGVGGGGGAAAGGQVLVFCGTRSKTESTCRALAGRFEESAHPGVAALRRDLVNGLFQATGKESPVLAQSVLRGVAFHHAGLLQEEKKMIEAAYRRGVVKVLCATTTVAAGVNLPADRVVIRGLVAYGAKNYYTHVQMQQMGGRSGRQGESSRDGGDVVVVLSRQIGPNSTRRTFEDRFLHESLPLVRSALLEPDAPAVTSGGGWSMTAGSASAAMTPSQPAQQRRFSVGKLAGFVLEAVCLGLATSRGALLGFLGSTFGFQHLPTGRDERAAAAEAALDGVLASLTENSQRQRPLLKFIAAYDVYLPEALGAASVAASLGPDDARALHDDIASSADALQLESSLHLLYLVVAGALPANGRRVASLDHDGWRRFHEFMMYEPPSAMAAGAQAIAETFDPCWRAKLQSLAYGMTPGSGANGGSTVGRLKRLYCACVLQAKINETVFDMRGGGGGGGGGGGAQQQQQQSQQQQNVDGFVAEVAERCNSVMVFCRELGHDALAATLKPLRDRLQHGVKLDLVPLRCLTSCVSVSLVRFLFEQGFKTLRSFRRAGARAAIVECLAHRRRSYYQQGGMGGGGMGGGGAHELALRRNEEELADRILAAAEAGLDAKKKRAAALGGKAKRGSA